MSFVGPGSTRSNLFDRIKGMLLRPGATWELAEREPAAKADLYRYVAILAGVAAACELIGLLQFGIGVFDVTYKPRWTVALGEVAAGYLLTFVQVFAVAVAIDRLAERFGGRRDWINALTVAACAPTAIWIAGIANLAPTLGGLVVPMAALYSLHVLYLGLARLMKTPEERRLPYFMLILAVAVLCAALVNWAKLQVRDLGGPLSMAWLTAPATS